jgi:hypothetical protein
MFTLKHEGLGYICKKNKSAFIDKKTTFKKECDLYCSKCKNTGHLDKDCTGSKIMHCLYRSCHSQVPLYKERCKMMPDLMDTSTPRI